MQQSDWRAFVSLVSRTLENGEVAEASALLMKRRDKGVWVYRRPTAEEEADYVSSDAW